MNRRPMPPIRSRLLFRLLVGVGVVTGAAVVVATPAFAHVGAASTKAADDGTTTIIFEFDEACEPGTAVTSLKVTVPSGTTDIKPEPSDKGGPSIADKTDAHFPVSMKLPGKKGDTVKLPAIKTCDKGTFSATEEADFAPTVASGPAPSITIGLVDVTEGPAAAAAPNAWTAKVTGNDIVWSAPAAAAPAASESASSSSSMGLIIAAVAVVIIIGGGAAFAMSRKKS